MLTVKEFRSQYDLTEAQFKTVRKMADERSSSPVVTRQGSNTWMIVNEALLLEALGECKKTSRIKVKSEVLPEPQILEVEIMPAEKVNGFGSMELFKPSNSFNPVTALSDFHRPAITYKAVSTAEDVQIMQQAMYEQAIESKTLQDARFEALKRQAIEQGIKEGQELARLKYAATQQVLNNGSDFLAQTQGLKAE